MNRLLRYVVCRGNPRSVARGFWFVASSFALGLVTDVRGQVSRTEGAIPLQHLLTEAESHRAAKREAEAAVLLDRVLQRSERGEALPAGIDRDRLRLAAAQAHLRSGGTAQAMTWARQVVASPAAKALHADARWVWGIALWQGGQNEAAIPVLAELATHPQWGAQARLFQAMAARAAGQLDLAARLYESAADRRAPATEGAEITLTLAEIHLERGRWVDAARELGRLRHETAAIDAYIGWAHLVLRTGDAALAADDATVALELYQSVPPREDLLRGQAERERRMETQATTLRSLAGAGASSPEGASRLDQRRAQAKQARELLARTTDFDATVAIRRGRAFFGRGLVWETALVCERLVDRHPESLEGELAFALWIRALAEARRTDRLGTVVPRFLAAYPKSSHAAQALTLAAQAAGERGDREDQVRLIAQALERSPATELKETLLLLHAHALFAAGRHEQARAAAERSREAFPEGRYLEEAIYLQAMAGLLAGKPQRALEELAAYRARFPNGRFWTDAQYREASAHFALEQNDQALEHLADWLRRHPADHGQCGEVYSLQGDVLVALRREDEAIAAYEQALAHPLHEAGWGYVMDELTRLQMARRDYEAAARRWEQMMARDPSHPAMVQAAYWIGRIRRQAGDPAGARAGMVALVRPHLSDPDQDDVERVLLELARIPGSPPTPVSGVGETYRTGDSGPVETWLLAGEQLTSPTARARAWLVEAELAALARQPEQSTVWLGRISRECAVEVLPAGILGRVGDFHAARGDHEAARRAYTHLVKTKPKSPFADAGYVGLGEFALEAGHPEEALKHFTAAIDQVGARYKVKEATLGRARALQALERWEEARQLFEQIAANRAWRGETTAQSVFALGELHARMKDPEALAQAQGFFQRVYLGYRKFLPWVARAYLRSGEVFEELGQPGEALRTYQELLRDARLAASEEAAVARGHVRRLEQKGPAT